MAGGTTAMPAASATNLKAAQTTTAIRLWQRKPSLTLTRSATATRAALIAATNTTPPARVEMFRGFSIEKSKIVSKSNVTEHRITGLPKGTFTNPQMQWGWVKLDEFINDAITNSAVNVVWRGFWRRQRELISANSDPTNKEFWVSIAKNAAKVGPQAVLLFEGYVRLLMEWAHLPEKRPIGLRIENRAAAERTSGRYVTTVEGVDVYMGDGLPSGNAILFSSTSLQKIIYEPISADGRLLNLVFEPEGDPWKVSLVAQFSQSVSWDNSPILEVQFPKTAQEPD